MLNEVLCGFRARDGLTGGNGNRVGVVLSAIEGWFGNERVVPSDSNELSTYEYCMLPQLRAKRCCLPRILLRWHYLRTVLLFYNLRIILRSVWDTRA